jgi:hypothetical protein
MFYKRIFSPFGVAFTLAMCIVSVSFAQQTIDRKALVERHTIKVNGFDTLSSLTVGNGEFAFTVDATGLQTFPEYYANGIPLGTQSEWGWHSFPNVSNFTFDEVLKTYHLNGRDVTYAVQYPEPGRHRDAADYFRQNVHRLQLGNIGFELLKKDGTIATITDIKNIQQQLNMWTGEIRSTFYFDETLVTVTTYGHQTQDAIAVNVESGLINEGRLFVRIRFPYPNGEWADMGNNYYKDNQHQSGIVSQNSSTALLQHTLDTTQYFVTLNHSGATIKEKSSHYFLIQPKAGNSFQLACRFNEKKSSLRLPDFASTKKDSESNWQKFWKRGGAIDFSGSTDNRANELERRIVAAQYLTKVQCAGNQPPQETGLTYNSWYGKPHLEMHWWHGVHFALWGRLDLLEKSLAWYKKTAHYAYEIAQRQGYKGLRWQKVTDNVGRESPSSIGAMLIWQQPHFIYMAELCRRQYNDLATINKYKDLVFPSAEWMADFAYFDSVKGRYILGPGVIPAQERFKADTTFNPTYELAYWRWALDIAQQWRKKLNLPPNKKWGDVLAKLSPLPIQDGQYLTTESATDSYTNPVYKTDHPSVLGTLGMLPKVAGTDIAVMHKTFNWVWNNWTWDKTWGWDYPMVAMTATRLGLPDKAIDALLMPVRSNTYLPNGHNYQDGRLTMYLPGNGGLLTAVAMMFGGYDGSGPTPGLIQSGQWKVRWQGLKKMP